MYFPMGYQNKIFEEQALFNIKPSRHLSVHCNCFEINSNCITLILALEFCIFKETFEKLFKILFPNVGSN